ncbi:hypothetical protein Acsp06_65150 [Actinomycetospora sp. NBRC 106375]|uniref:hypothetical protein n=1 Tax=Actinomycetospora sp. NBRC 106375 TaxID=3032207 RepID=UPI0024A0AFFC|nr:hypothetical protein [Actinomycetospora sp. NBRC 106375]GLZ50330.1 hypothetical protein Acsp06_65150 [Actinomycetospora sp. NBRC 106375]
MSTVKRATPNGLCWDDCGGAPKPGSFFLPGHDKRAERYLTAIDGASSIADKLAARGYVPGQGSLRAATLASDSTYEECGRRTLDGSDCRVIGRGAGMRRHRADDDQHLPADS